jgi:hypothetical protein
MIKARALLQMIVLPLLLLPAASCISLSGDGTAGVGVNADNTSAQPRVRNTLRGRILENPQEGIRVRLPRGWQVAPSGTLHADADLYAYSPDREMFLLVLGESSTSVNHFSLEDNAREYRKLLSNGFENLGQEEGTGMTELGNSSATQYLMRGQVAGQPVAYLHTTVAGSDRFYQVVSWTSEELYNENREEMQTVIASFQEF